MHLALFPSLLLAAAVAVAGNAQALGGVNMVLGRIVLPRADAPTVATTTSARSHYVLACAGCHGLQGQGRPQAYVPDLRLMGNWLRVPGGRHYLISVPGMMATGLNDAQVAEVANWLLATVARTPPPADHPPYTAAEVARVRARPLLDVAAERQRLLLQAQALGLALH